MGKHLDVFPHMFTESATNTEFYAGNWSLEWYLTGEEKEREKDKTERVNFLPFWMAGYSFIPLYYLETAWQLKEYIKLHSLDFDTWMHLLLIPKWDKELSQENIFFKSGNNNNNYDYYYYYYYSRSQNFNIFQL